VGWRPPQGTTPRPHPLGSVWPSDPGGEMARSSTELRIVIDIEVTDVDRFKELVAQCVAISRDEPGTLVYDWYCDEEAGTARLYEAYESPSALAVHTSGPVFTEVGPKLMETCRFVGIEAFGDPETLRGAEALAPTKLWGLPFEALDP
jgi:quinol monooxygenase YgiN